MSSRKYAIFFSLTAMYVIAYFYRVSAAVIAGDLTVDLHLSPAQLGNISSALFYAFAVAQLPLGPALDRIGPRKTIFALGLVTTAGAILFAVADGYAAAMAGRILIGGGTACVLMGSLKVYTAWFPPRRFATLAGLQVAIGNAGNLLATAPLAWMAGMWGWRHAFTAISLLTAAMATVIFIVVRDVPPGGSAPERVGVGKGWASVIGSAPFWGLSLLAFFWYGSYMAVQGLWGGPYLMNVLGFDRNGAARLLLLVAAGFICGCPLAGYLSDRIFASRKKVLLAGQGGLLLLLLLFLGPLEVFPSFLLPPLFFLFGLCVSTGPLLYAQTKEIFSGSLSATAMTAVNFFVVLGAALTQQIMGGILERAGCGFPPTPDAFHLAFSFPVAGLAAGICGYLFTPDTGPR